MAKKEFDELIGFYVNDKYSNSEPYDNVQVFEEERGLHPINPSLIKIYCKKMRSELNHNSKAKGRYSNGEPYDNIPILGEEEAYAQLLHFSSTKEWIKLILIIVFWIGRQALE